MSTRWDLTPQEIADTCETTAAILEGNWIRGTWWDADKQAYCIEGALAAALQMDPIDMADNGHERNVLQSCPVYTAVMRTVIEQIIATEDDEDVDAAVQSVEDDGLPWWNDRDYRTEQEVVDILHLTAKRVLGVGPDDA